MEELFNRTWQTDELYFRYSSDQSRAANDEEFHPYHELIFFIDGDAELVTEKSRQKLLPHTLIVLPKHTFHQLLIHGTDKKYVRCVFQFERVSGLETLVQEKLDSFRLLYGNELTKTVLTYKNVATMSLSNEEKDALLRAFFTLLLVHMHARDALTLAADSFHPITEKTIERVKENAASIGGVSDLASALGVSPSYLSHVFKSDMQIPLYEYILDNKLLLAHEKLHAGTSAADAAIECGFNDYSGFFRQYKKKFGFPPSKTTAKSRK